jgi:hypothetical protein
MAGLRSRRTEILGALSAGSLVVLFCLILLWHNAHVFWNDDYELSVLPVLADMARSWSEGHWPILSPYSWVCGNLAGEFQYGTFSVFVNAAVILIWKFPLTFPQQAAAVSIAHLFALAIGAFLLGRDHRIVKWLDYMLGRQRLVRCARCVYVVAMGVVGSGTRFGFATNKMAISLAGAIRLSPRYGRISLHGFNAAPPRCMVVDQITGPSAQYFLNFAPARRRGARFWSFRARVACAP